MARYLGPTTRISRRFNQPIFGATKAYEKRQYPPGQHGPKLRRKMSEYAVGLNEKQKLRYTYGLLERQFRRLFEMAKRERGVTGERFMQLLETRLDSVVYLLGFAKSRAAARQIVNHGHVRVNGHKVDIASYSVQSGDEIEIKNTPTSRQIATRNLE
jgi:small subunit ribosomal protein S4